MLAHSREVQYIHEPFNLKCRAGVCWARFENWYSYVDESVDRYDEIYAALSDTLRLKYSVGEELKDIDSIRDTLRMVRDCWFAHQGRLKGLRPLMKDPLALFSAEWLSKTFDMNVVILIRHPAAFVSSLKVKKWSCPFPDLLNQPHLVRRYLQAFEADMHRCIAEKKDIIDQSILLWRIIHSVIQQYREQYPEWIYLRHEDLSRNPLTEFSQIYHALGLDYTDQIQSKIAASTGQSNPKETTPNIHNVNRNSEANIWNWQERLTQTEIERIYEGTTDIGRLFYSDADWELPMPI